jgi:hypothetical protein
LSDIHPATGRRSASAIALARWSNRRTSSLVLERSGSANHTRFAVNSRTT